MNCATANQPNSVTAYLDNGTRLTSMTYKKSDNATVIEQISYTYDARGQQISKTTTNSYPVADEGAYSGSYDSANRLTQLTTKGTGANNTDETFNLAYDTNGNMVSKAKADGTDTTTYIWDTQNRLTGLTRAGSGAGSNAITASFKYDLANRRVEKTINGNTIKFIYDGDQIVGEQNSDGTTTSVLAGLAIDEMIARYPNGQQSTYLTDALGSVIAQLKDDQTVQNQYGYSPYGNTVKGNNGAVDGSVDDKGNASQYTGRENDGTGLYYYRARYYMTSCGRFISEDPIGLGGGQTNLYAYVGGDPVSFLDPFGWAKSMKELILRKVPDAMKEGMGKGFGEGIGDLIALKLACNGQSSAACLKECTETVVPVRDKMLDTLPSNAANALNGLIRRNIDEEAAGLIDECTGQCNKKLPEVQKKISDLVLKPQMCTK